MFFFWPMVHSKEFIARGSWQAGLLEFLAPRMEKPTTPLRRGETLNHFELGKQTGKKKKKPRIQSDLGPNPSKFGLCGGSQQNEWQSIFLGARSTLNLYDPRFLPYHHHSSPAQR